MVNRLYEMLPNPTFVDYQNPEHARGEDFYNEQKMLDYGRRIVEEMCNIVLHYSSVDEGVEVAKKQFGVE